MTVTKRLKTATDLGALAQAAGAATLTAPVGKRRSSMQHPYAELGNINYQSSNTGGGSPSNGTREPCKNWKSTSHGTKWCPSPKCYEKNCGNVDITDEYH